MLYLDFKKAFDSVPHDRLLEKVEELQIGGNFLKIIASYLTERKQYVKVNECKSEVFPVTSGVPQGSLLGPLLFIIYVNDLPTRVKLCDAFGYADDFKLVSTQPADIRTDLEAIESWCEVNKMKLNENKCYVLPVKQQQNSEYHFQLNSKFLESKFEQKDLGVIISAKLSWRANRLKRCKNLRKLSIFSSETYRF